MLSATLCYVYPDSSVGEESACSARRPRFDSWVRKIPWRRDRPPTPVFWPGESHGLCSPWGRKESDTTERLSLHSLLFTFCNSARDSVKHMYNLVHILFHLAYYGMLNIAPWGAQGDLVVSPSVDKSLHPLTPNPRSFPPCSPSPRGTHRFVSVSQVDLYRILDSTCKW